MTATNTKDGFDQLTARGKWDGDVVGANSTEWCWGTHTFDVHLTLFADDEGHIEVQAPREPPLCAREIVADALDGDTLDVAVGEVLAEAWGLDRSKMGDR